MARSRSSQQLFSCFLLLPRDKVRGERGRPAKSRDPAPAPTTTASPGAQGVVAGLSCEHKLHGSRAARVARPPRAARAVVFVLGLNLLRFQNAARRFVDVPMRFLARFRAVPNEIAATAPLHRSSLCSAPTTCVRLAETLLRIGAYRPLRREILQIHFLPFRATKCADRIERQIEEKHKYFIAFMQDAKLEYEIALGKIKLESYVAGGRRAHHQRLVKHSLLRHRRAHHARQNRVRLQDDPSTLEKRVDS